MKTLELYLGDCDIPPFVTDHDPSLLEIKLYIDSILGDSYDLKVCELAGGLYSECIKKWVKFRPTEFD